MFDCPEVACRVLKLKLDALLFGLKSGEIWGPKTLITDEDGARMYKYSVKGRDGREGHIIHVIEYQQRGMVLCKESKNVRCVVVQGACCAM